MFSSPLEAPVRLFLARILLVTVTVVCGLFFCGCVAAERTLNINTNSKDRQFLIDSQQNIIIAFASPLSESNNIVAALAFQPIADSMTVAFDPSAKLYLSQQWPVKAFDTIKAAYISSVVYGGMYAFNGVEIIGYASGVDGHVTIYFDAPPSSTRPVTTGLASYIYDKATAKPAAPSPINYYALYRFETRVMSAPSPIIVVFVASAVYAGTVLPTNILKPAPHSVPIFNEGGASPSVVTSSVIQIGRYLPVDLDAPEQSSIHFDLMANAFAYGP